MYNRLLLILLVVISTVLSSCEVVGGIFKAGVWTGFIIIAVIVALILWVLSKARGK